MSNVHGCAVVTGGSRGIGAAAVRYLAADGYDVVINHVSESSGPKAQALLDELHEQYGTEGIIVRGDVQDYNACKELIDKAIERFGKIAVLVNNAGIQFGKKFTDCTPEDYTKPMVFLI